MNCAHCGHVMIDNFTTFTIVKNRHVYVTESVPCFECPVCGHIVFSQDTSKRLEEYASGRVVPSDTSYKVFVFRWNEEVVTIKERVPTEGYVTPKLVNVGSMPLPVHV